MTACKRDRVTVQRDTSAAGTRTPSWSALWQNVPANISTVNGGEEFRGRQMEARAKYAVEILWRAGLTSKDRLLVLSGPLSGKTLNILAVGVNDRRAQAGPPEYLIQCGE